MSYYHSIIAVLAMTLAVSPALAQTTTSGVDAVINASPSVASTPAAKAVVSEAITDVVTQSVSTETFAGTGASMHTEDQCKVADLSVSRFKPSVGATTTFLFYNVNDLCDASQSASGSLEIPDAAFSLDPRTSNKVVLTIDLAAVQNQVLGPPLNANLTFAKTPTASPSSVNRFNNRSVADTHDDAGVRKVVTFNTVGVSTTARVTGTSNLFPLNAETTATIFWDDTKNVTELP